MPKLERIFIGGKSELPEREYKDAGKASFQVGIHITSLKIKSELRERHIVFNKSLMKKEDFLEAIDQFLSEKDVYLINAEYSFPLFGHPRLDGKLLKKY